MKSDFLAAVAASQVDFSLTSSAPLELDNMGVYRFNTCAITYYGRSYNTLNVSDVSAPSDSPVVKVSELLEV